MQVNKLTVKSRNAQQQPAQYTLVYRPPPVAEGDEAPPLPISVRIRGIPEAHTLAGWQAEHPAP